MRVERGLRETREELIARLDRCNLFEEGKLREGWFRAFKKRFKARGLKLKKPEPISAKRLEVTEKDVTQWFYDRTEYFKEKNLSDVIADPKRMYNIDETFVKFTDNKGLVLTSEKPGEKNNCFRQNSGVTDKGGVTTVILVNAEGDSVEPMIILKRERLNEEQFKDSI